LARLYGRTYDHTRWPDHIERVAETTRLLDEFAAAMGSVSVADLSCGDGAIVNGSRHPWARRVLGDLTTTGPIETAVRDLEPVDLFVCSETIEHVDDPDGLLVDIGKVARHLLLTTPLGETDPDNNPEHYWGWGAMDMAEMLADAGWTWREMTTFTPQSVRHYTFQMWRCSR
jgi:hypothetical protein